MTLCFVQIVEVKKEHNVDGTKEEVITSNIDCDFSDDSMRLHMSEHIKLTPAGIPGIDLSEPQQLAKLVMNSNISWPTSQTFN